MAINKHQIASLNTVVNNFSSNQYTLTIVGLNSNSVLSVLSITGQEHLNQPWCYTVTFTSTDKQLMIDSVLSQSGSLTFYPLQPIKQAIQISSLDRPAIPRTIYGVITEFSQLSVNKEEACYQVVLQSRLALLDNDHYSAIYQNQSVVEVVKEILRRHDFTDINYRLALKETYPVREFITQWQESDLAFIQRLLADVGIWFRFEIHEQHHCDVLVLSDYEQGYDDARHISYHLPSDMIDKGRDSVWDLQFQSKTVQQQVQVQDYNYRQAEINMLAQINTQPKDKTTKGTSYLYGEHFNSKGNDSTIESGSWYAKIRHEQHISQQIIIRGQCNDYHLVPGQRIIITNSNMHGISQGIIILSTQSYGDRSQSYTTSFTAIPFNVLKPYRPVPISWPQIGGTLPAKITSPDNDTYGYLDTQGRYRVKFNFDLKTWRNGEESLWVRLAKPYAGDTYGFHFPLIDGTEVAIGFVGGNPDRPYIAHAMHDSHHPDHVSTANKNRNVIRTPANNKLRMDDKRGKEHIKLATEYGKTQLNIGHIVNQNKQQRGEGFELRTDEWGAIRAAKGLYITAQGKYKADGDVLDINQPVSELEQALHMVNKLNQQAKAAKASLADLQNQQKLLEEKIKQLTDSAILQYAPAGVATVTPGSIQNTAGNNIIQTAQNSIDISAFKRFMVNAGNRISLFASKMGINIFAAQGKIDIQAQNDELHLTGNKHVKLTSVGHEVTVSACNKLTLSCGDSAIIIEPNSIKLMSLGDIRTFSTSFGSFGPETLSVSPPQLPEGAHCEEQL